jgi:hypothetical protein
MSIMGATVTATPVILDVTTKNVDTLVARYEQTISRMEQMSRSGYQVKFSLNVSLSMLVYRPRTARQPRSVSESPVLQGRSVRGPYRGHAPTLKGAEMREYAVCGYNVHLSVYTQVFQVSVGHPVIHVGDTCIDKESCQRMDGQMKCSIVPPEKLYHPVLPILANQKLMFCLCRNCVLTADTGE